jgi:uncharacterized membrane protein YozB (DUF420 family)
LTILAAAHPIVHVNASLNALATVLLMVGLLLVKRGHIEAHKRTMLSAFAVSAAFLCCYLWYHWSVKHVEFTHEGTVKYVYYTILASHVVLAMTVPFLAVRQIYLGYRGLGCCGGQLTESELPTVTAEYRAKHVRMARWFFPIWLYVSVTGIVIYVMLYHLWPPVGE